MLWWDGQEKAQGQRTDKPRFRSETKLLSGKDGLPDRLTIHRWRTRLADEVRFAALAVYALQSKDESLYRMAVWIRARAIRRAGELLAEIERERTPQGTYLPSGRKALSDSAGLSADQRKTALRVANVPEATFEAAVEADRSATIPMLAALAVLARKARLGLGAQNRIAEIRLWNLRWGGEILAGMELKAGRPVKSSHAASISDLGLTYSDSSRWQLLARVPEAAWRAHIEAGR